MVKSLQTTPQNQSNPTKKVHTNQLISDKFLQFTCDDPVATENHPVILWTAACHPRTIRTLLSNHRIATV